jgi:DNA-binding Lrp family transcriptional regulator
VLEADGRASAASIAALTAIPATTVRRRLRALSAAGTLPTGVLVDPARLGLRVDANLNVAVWLPDLDDLYEFITRDLAALDVTTAETVLVGQAVKRPGM